MNCLLNILVAAILSAFVSKFNNNVAAGLSSSELESVTQVQIWEEAVCFSLHANALGKGIDLSVLSTAMDK